MKRLFESLHYAFVWLCRFRHRRGYNVHSPFAFNLITRVFFERGAFYAYAPLARRFGPGRTPRQLKVARLLLRLANEVQPARAALCGGGWDVQQAYLEAGCRRMAVSRVDTVEALVAQSPWGLLLVRAEALPPDVGALMARLAPGGLCIVWGIHRRRAARRAWRRVERCPQATITFDLYDVGLVFLPPRLHKQAYRVCF